ncbi:aldo/keto reductase [Kitasatospora purpeofusca]|uniref:aldo/keto reductase n=1 Tax=Kitasatospora purpeofusca TaxID=67352 RepID=UPI00367EFE57
MTDTPTRNPGSLAVSAQGLGCTGMNHGYGTSDDTQSIATLHRALDLGVTPLDTADFYGAGHNEELIGRAVAGRRDEVVIATEFGLANRLGEPTLIRGDSAHVRQACEASLRRLGVDRIDLHSAEGPAETDVRRSRPRFTDGNPERNPAIVAKPEELASAKGVTTGRPAPAWVRHRGEDVVPVPGTRRQRYPEENLAALDVELSPEGLAAVEAAAPVGQVAGTRYDATGPTFVDN